MSEVTQPIPTLEERFTQLERQFADLRAEVLGLQPRKKDWRRTVGMMPDDDLSRSAARLGRERRDLANPD